MSRVSLSIQMLNILSARGIVSKEELADRLETNVRNISEYKKELMLAGYEIESIPGKCGGYKLVRDSVLVSSKLTDAEKKALQSGTDYINKRYDFLEKNEFDKAIGKVLSGSNAPSIEESIIIDRFPLSMKQDDIKLRYDMVKDSISSSLKIEIEYLSSKNKVKKHKIHPYKLYMYNLAWYVLAFNESINDIGYFKINRIKSIEMTKEPFKVMKTFDERKYLDQFGMKQNGQFIDVKIKLKGPYAALVRERIYGKNQKLEFVDDNTTILSCAMQNIDNIVSFVLGCGSNAEVISPQELREKVKEEALKISKLY